MKMRMEQGLPPSTEEGMFVEMFRFAPDERCDLQDLIELFKLMNFRCNRENLMLLPKKTQKQFVKLTRDGKETRVGTRQR